VRSIALAALAILVGLGPACAQRDGVHRLGILLQNPRALAVVRSVLVPELAKQGFVEGRNLAVDLRAGAAEELPRLALELLAQHPGALVTSGGIALAAATAATSAVPVVTFGANPVDLGLARTLSRSGSNVTGVVILTRELDAKRLELLREGVPGARRLAALVNPLAPGAAASRREMSEVSATSGTELLTFEATGPSDYAAAYARMAASRAEALAIVADPQFNSDAALLARLALEAGLPTVCQWREMAEHGCLMSYGPSYAELWRQMARHIGLVLGGTLPTDIPIEQPTTLELLVNVRTARALGLAIPPNLLARADEVIE
jgi:putative tryptophan/tyrosine transport system substrate-binding protein